MGSRACTQVRLWHARDAAQQAGEGAEAPSKGLSWTCWVWPLDSVDFSSASSSEFGSGSSAAAGEAKGREDALNGVIDRCRWGESAERGGKRPR